MSTENTEQRIISGDEMMTALQVITEREPDRTNDGNCVYVRYELEGRGERDDLYVLERDVAEHAVEGGDAEAFTPLPHCIIGVALTELGVPLDVLEKLGVTEQFVERQVLSTLQDGGFRFEPVALDLASNVQNEADDGGRGELSWSSALTRALDPDPDEDAE